MKLKCCGFSLYFIFVTFIREGDGARILGVAPFPSYSHQIVFQSLWKELAKRGHELVVFTTHPFTNGSVPNITEIDWSYAIHIMNEEYNFDEIIRDDQGIFTEIINLLNIFGTIFRYEVMENPHFGNMLNNSDEHFDLVIVEYLFPSLGALARRFNCPFIGMISLELPDVLYDDVGLPVHPIIQPFTLLPFLRASSFMERLVSVITYYVSRLLLYIQEIFVINKEIKQIFGDDAPNSKEIRENVSLLFVNENPALIKPKATVPAFIQIGGNLQMKPAAPLPDDIKEFLDKSEETAIYFSLGTNVKLKHLSKESLNVISEVFAEVPYKIVWKVDDNFTLKLSKNILTKSWVPQQDVLHHPKVKLFITQGGLQSCEEALYSKVPILGLPFFADQMRNVQIFAAKGMGLFLNPRRLDKTTFKNAIYEIITKPEYRENVKSTLKISKDQMMTGLEKAVWWTEYVIRHKSAKHLRTPALDLPFYQYYFLDVLSVIIIILALALLFLYKLFKFIRHIFECEDINNKKVK